MYNAQGLDEQWKHLSRYRYNIQKSKSQLPLSHRQLNTDLEKKHEALVISYSAN